MFMKESDHYYLSQKEPLQSCLLALRNIILSQDPNISETLKWSIPCFCYRKKPFCYLSTENKTDLPYILMVEGIHLTHYRLEQGNRAKMKVFRIDPNEDIPLEDIKTVLQEGLNLYINGVVNYK